MAALLFYWKGERYHRDRLSGLPSRLHQNSPRMHETSSGESLWAFTRNSTGRYVLAMELIASKLGQRPERNPGQYWVQGDPHRSRCFDVDAGESAEGVIRSFRSLAIKDITLGLSFRGGAGVRVLSPDEHERMRKFAAAQPTASPDELKMRLVQKRATGNPAD